MTQPIAALPMYDWPEARAATDRLWSLVRDGLRARGVAAPEGLSRGLAPGETWRHPGLVLGQTCGLPLVRTLPGLVVLGAAEHRLEGCPPGWYRSAIVVRADDRRDSLAAFAGGTAAVNDRGSQSGWAALCHHAPAGFAAVRLTGAHLASVAAVAGGAADVAAIDAVTWRHALVHHPAAAELRVLRWTDPTPALPYVAAAGADPGPIRAALQDAMAGLAAEEAAALGVFGFVPLERSDYAVIAARAGGL